MAQRPLFDAALEPSLGVPANPASPVAVLGSFPEVREAIEDGAERIPVGGKDPIDALEDAAERVNRAVEKYHEWVG